jgi:hypothetical protein
MALQTDAIESRLEGLKQDDRRMMFDSKLRAFRLDSKTAAVSGSRASKSSRGRTDPPYPVDQVISLLEELSRRIDGLERKDRALADEIRKRARQDQKRRSVIAAVGVTSGVVLFACWMLKLL